MTNQNLVSVALLNQQDALQSAATEFVYKLKHQQLDAALDLFHRLPASAIRYLQRTIWHDTLRALVHQPIKHSSELFEIADPKAQAFEKHSFDLQELLGLALTVLRQRLQEEDSGMKDLHLDLLQQCEQSLQGETEKPEKLQNLAQRHQVNLQQVYYQRRHIYKRLSAMLRRLGL